MLQDKNDLEQKTLLDESKEIIKVILKSKLTELEEKYSSTAKAVQKALTICTTYYNHFKKDIREQAETLTADDKTLDLGVRKCYHVKKMIRILENSSEPNNKKKMQDFIAAYKEAKPVVEERRDHPAMTFLKCIATLITVGLAQLLGGLWKNPQKCSF